MPGLEGAAGTGAPAVGADGGDTGAGAATALSIARGASADFCDTLN